MAPHSSLYGKKMTLKGNHTMNLRLPVPHENVMRMREVEDTSSKSNHTKAAHGYFNTMMLSL